MDFFRGEGDVKEKGHLKKESANNMVIILMSLYVKKRNELSLFPDHPKQIDLSLRAGSLFGGAT